jgi:hypothetical protein
MSRPTSRRLFLQHTSAAGLFAAGLHVSGAPARASLSANDKLNIAAIGVANKGGHNIDELAGQNFVALCDVDENYLTQWGEKHPQARRYRDYRVMLEKEAKNIDAVVVSTADHTHAPRSWRRRTSWRRRWGRRSMRPTTTGGWWRLCRGE